MNFYQTLEGGLIDLAKLNSNWLTIRPRADGRALFASRIPIDDQRELLIKGTRVTANLPDIPHDKGDYLVCYAKPDNTPDSDNAWLVNGAVFKATFDMRGFEDIN